MNKRDTIMVVFRVIAIFLLFFTLTLIPNVIMEWQRVGSLFAPSSLIAKLVNSILILGIPLAIVYMLWNRSGWIADKILAPFGMDELWTDEPAEEIIIEEIADDQTLPVPEPSPFPESTITHLTKDEIEDLVLTAISILVLFYSLPDLVRVLYLFTQEHGFSWSYLISPLGKTLLAGWLLFRTNDLSSWLRRWRNLRMK